MDSAMLRALPPADEPFLWHALYLALHAPPGAEPFAPGVARAPEIARYVEGWMQRPGDFGGSAELGAGHSGFGASCARRRGAPSR